MGGPRSNFMLLKPCNGPLGAAAAARIVENTICIKLDGAVYKRRILTPCTNFGRGLARGQYLTIAL
jgi:hypothetical protein